MYTVHIYNCCDVYVIVVLASQLLLKSVKLDNLPDKGRRLKGQVDDLTKSLQELDLQIKTEQEVVAKQPGVVIKTVNSGAQGDAGEESRW